jgi:hypothetical protein
MVVEWRILPMSDGMKRFSKLFLPAAIAVVMGGPAAAQPVVVQARPVPRGVAAGQMPTQLRVYYDNEQGRVVLLRPDESLPIYGRDEIQLWLEAWDARGRQWPQDQLKYQVVTQNGCGGRYEIQAMTPHRFRIRVLRNDAFNCELYARLVSPRTIERPLRVTWGLGGNAANYGRDDAEYVVDRLYRALLLREPDREGFYTAVNEVDSGRVAEVVRRLFESPEFASSHRGWSTSRLLDSIYRGLLGRTPDESAVRGYKGRLADRNERVRVVMEILASREFNNLLDRNVVAGNPCQSGGPSAPCDLRVYYEDRDGRAVALGQNDRLELGSDGTSRLWLEALDQYGREITRSELRYRILADQDCKNQLDVHPLTANRYSLRTLSEDAGQCRLVVRLDSPRQVDRAVDVRWDGSGYGYGGYNRYGQIYNQEDSEFIVNRLYRTLLDRTPSGDDYDAAVRQVQNGGLRALVDALTSSPEFLADQRRLESDQIIDGLYSGLIDRRPANTDVYRDADGRVDYLAVVLQLLSSPEFRALLARQR